MLNEPISLDVKSRALARRSTRAGTWALEFDREITVDDLQGLYTASLLEPNNPKAPLAAIRDPHHTLAMYVAQDMAVVKISRITGYSVSRIHMLRADPAFLELVAHYKESQVLAEADVTMQVKHIALTAGQLLQEKLEQDPDQFSVKELRELMRDGLDRIGHGPGGKLTIDANDPSRIIDALKQAMHAEGRGKVLSREAIIAEYTEITNVETPQSTPVGESGTHGEGAVRQVAPTLR